MHSNPPPFRETVTKSIQTLKIQQGKLNAASHRLKGRHDFLFQTCVSAIQKENKERAAIWANEISEVRKLLQFLCSVELAIERVILRLETIRELSDVVVDLKPSLRLLQNVSRQLMEVLPDVSSELSQVNDTISDTLYSTKITADDSSIPVNLKTPGGQEILKEVNCYLEQQLSEKLPEPPVTSKAQESQHTKIRQMIAIGTSTSEKEGRESSEESGKDSSQTLFSYKKAEIKEFSVTLENQDKLEDIVLDYVRKQKGQLDLTRCSVELDTSNDQIEKALQSLGSKGKIRIELNSGE